MFCEKCGHELKNDEKFCGKCGVPVSEPVKEQAVKKKNKKIKLLLPIFAGVAVVIAVLAVHFLSANKINSSPESVAEASVESQMVSDAEKFVECIPPGMVNMMKTYCGGSKDAVINYFEKNMPISDIPENFKIISSNIYNDEYELEEYKESDDSRMFLYDAEDYKLVEVKSLLDGEIKTNIVFCAKIGNKWYAVAFD